MPAETRSMLEKLDELKARINDGENIQNEYDQLKADIHQSPLKVWLNSLEKEYRSNASIIPDEAMAEASVFAVFSQKIC